MSVLLGMASKDERGKYSGGVAGDQTGKEVYIRSWYSRPWDTYILLNSATDRENFAHALETICNCPKVGYSQSDRLSLWNECEKIGWNLSKINSINPCNCDCSSLMPVCARFAGIKVSKDIWTGNLEAAFKATGKVTVYKQSRYLTSDKYIQRGGILLNTAHHVAGVLTTGSGVTTTGNNNSTTNTTTGETKVAQYAGVVNVSSYLNVRTGAGTNNPTYKVGGVDFRLPKGMVISIEQEKSGWGKLTGVDGWVSLTYVKK